MNALPCHGVDVLYTANMVRLRRSHNPPGSTPRALLSRCPLRLTHSSDHDSVVRDQFGQRYFILRRCNRSTSIWCFCYTALPRVVFALTLASASSRGCFCVRTLPHPSAYTRSRTSGAARCTSSLLSNSVVKNVSCFCLNTTFSMPPTFPNERQSSPAALSAPPGPVPPAGFVSRSSVS